MICLLLDSALIYIDLINNQKLEYMRLINDKIPII